ncbi:MAG: Crp/Fnr family transcriptional regulator [Eubacteriales bacterium]|nr:Crp/Fnr family transcriptional regulator [Eubacteriales bacterium]
MLTTVQITKLDNLFPVLKKLPAKDRDILFSAGQIVELPEDQMLMQQRQQCQFVPFVISGILRIYKLSPNGREMTLYRTASGETCLASIACQLTGDEFPALAQVEESAELFMVPATIYHDVLDKHLAWKDFLINSIYSHLTETMQTLEAVAFDRTDNRLVQWLLDQTQHKKGTIRYTHEAIAVELGTAREVVSRLLGELKAQGAVQLGRGRIEVLNPVLLKQLLN